MKFLQHVFNSRDFLPPFGATRKINDIAGNLYQNATYIRLVVREFVDATIIAQLRYLPSTSGGFDKDYNFVKIDSSTNAVTIYPAATDTIEGATSYTLAAQYDSVIFMPHNGVWYILP